MDRRRCVALVAFVALCALVLVPAPAPVQAQQGVFVTAIPGGWVRAAAIRGGCDPNQGTCNYSTSPRADLYEDRNVRDPRSGIYRTGEGPTTKILNSRAYNRPECQYRGVNYGSAAGSWHRGTYFTPTVRDGINGYLRYGEHWAFAPIDRCAANLAPTATARPYVPPGGAPTATPRASGDGNPRVSIVVRIIGSPPAGGDVRRDGEGSYAPGSTVVAAVARTGSWATTAAYQETDAGGCGGNGSERVSFAMPTSDCTVTFDIIFDNLPDTLVPTPTPPPLCSNRTGPTEPPGFAAIVVAVNHAGATTLADQPATPIRGNVAAAAPAALASVPSITPRSDGTVLIQYALNGLSSRFEPGAGGQFEASLYLIDTTPGAAIRDVLRVDLRSYRRVDVLPGFTDPAGERILRVTRSDLATPASGAPFAITWAADAPGAPYTAFAAWNQSRTEFFTPYRAHPMLNRFLVRTGDAVVAAVFTAIPGHRYEVRAMAGAGPCSIDIGYWSRVGFQVGDGRSIQGTIWDVTDPGREVAAAAATNRVQLLVRAGASYTEVASTATNTGRFTLAYSRQQVEQILRSSGQASADLSVPVLDATPVDYLLRVQPAFPPYRLAQRNAEFADAPAGPLDRMPGQIVGTTELGALFAADRSGLNYYVRTLPEVIDTANVYLMARAEHPDPAVDPPGFLSTRTNATPLAIRWWYGRNLAFYPTVDLVNGVGGCGALALDDPTLWPGYTLDCDLDGWDWYGAGPVDWPEDFYPEPDSACRLSPGTPVRVRWSKFEHTGWREPGDFSEVDPCRDNPRYPYAVWKVDDDRTLHFVLRLRTQLRAPDGTPVGASTVRYLPGGGIAPPDVVYAAHVRLHVVVLGGN